MAGFGNNFGRDIAKYAQRTGKKIAAVNMAIAMETLKGIVMDTPVDTGRLRGNWQTSAGTPIMTTIDREDKSGSAVMGEMAANINPMGVTYMTNNLPYAKRRNDEGGAGGVNAGFVEKNFARVERNVKQAVGNAKD